MNFRVCMYFVFMILVVSSCADDQDNNNGNFNNPNDLDEVAALPLEVNDPIQNPSSAEKVELGRLLFWDPILSGGMDMTCASCHHPDHAYADGLERSRGVGGTLIDRNSPTVLNTGYNGIGFTANYNPSQAPMFWDNRTEGLEAQSIEPILSAVEMRGNTISEDAILDVVVGRLNNVPEYVSLFESVFGSAAISEERIAEAIASFERSLVANNSRFDQYMRGDENALTDDELEGLEDFIEVGCADCHGGAMFSDFELHTLSVPNNGVNDNGATGDFDFRTPTLRNVALTGPYMHNGAFDSLEDVLEFYNDISRGNGNSQNNNVNDNQIADEARDLDLNNNQINDIVAFLNSLTDTDFDRRIPQQLPSGLPVGGRP